MRFILAGMMLAFAPAIAQTQTSPTQQTDAQLAANMARGDLLYAYDQAAWHVTDAALAAMPKDAKDRLKGFVVTPDAAGYRTTFFGGDATRPFRLYSAVWTGREVRDAQLYPVDGSVPVSGEEARLIGARTIALANPGKLAVCTKAAPNVAVIPGSRPEDPISVYVLSSMTTMGEVPLGGHHRIDVKDGKVVARRQFAKSCIGYSTKQMPKGAQPAAFVITHLLDPVPTEIHAFSLHYMPVPLAIGIPPSGMYMLRLKDGRATARNLQGK